MAVSDTIARFEALSTHLPIGVIVQDDRAEVVLCNPAALNLLGVTRDELVGRRAFDSGWSVVHEDGTRFASDAQPVAEAVRRRCTVASVIMGVLRPRRGDRVWLEVHAIPIVAGDGEVREVISVFCDISERRRCQELARRLREAELEIEDAPLTQAFPGRSPATLRLRDEIAEAARTLDDLPVLVLGEPGTGKTHVAQTLHALSSRGAGRFEAVNCAGISASLFESEVFGHEKGAFTGAFTSRPGRFELAQRGTLFLDEIGDLPLDQQAKLLVALQERSVRRIGGKADIAVDIAVVAATNHDIPRRVAAGLFRADLYDRVNGFTIRVAPLRERGEDLDVLLDRFVRTAAHRARKAIREIHPDVLDALHRFPWPGNLRQLDFVARRMVARARDSVLTLDLVPEEILAPQAAPDGPFETPSKARIEEVLVVHDGNVRRTAAHLRISRTRLYRLMEKYRITR